MTTRREKVEEEYPLPSLPTPEDIIQAVQDILSKSHVDRIVYERGRIVVRWNRKPGQELKPQKATPDDVVGRIELKEIETTGNPYADYFKAQIMLQAQHLFPGYVVVGRDTRMRKWLKIPSMFPLHNRLAGPAIVVEKEYEPYHLIVLGVPLVGSRMEEAVAGIKISMEV